MVSHLAGLNSQCSGRRRESVNPPTSSWERAASARKRQKRSVPRGWKPGEHGGRGALSGRRAGASCIGSWGLGAKAEQKRRAGRGTQPGRRSIEPLTH
jgi:hypothetical protein